MPQVDELCCQNTFISYFCANTKRTECENLIPNPKYTNFVSQMELRTSILRQADRMDWFIIHLRSCPHLSHGLSLFMPPIFCILGSFPARLMPRLTGHTCDSRSSKPSSIKNVHADFLFCRSPVSPVTCVLRNTNYYFCHI